ncbi:hypothetical protein LX36DRAFT_695307 [Colletotrichum falcatum]|nr:hypothetical protein LX36DRAFT_695307 [Colletotrichum falcatum]
MPPKKNSRPAFRCHRMSTRSTPGWQGESSSPESSVADSSPGSSSPRVPDMPNTSRKRRRSALESEDPEASSSNGRPTKKLKVSNSSDSESGDSDDAEGSLPIRRPMRRLTISEKSSSADIDSDDDFDDRMSPFESGDETDGGHAGSASLVPNLHVRSDGFWPNIRDDYLRSLEDQITRIDIPCVICGDDCIIDTESGWLWACKRPGGIGRELPVILCCGHMVGDECLERWSQARRDQGEAPSCPICRMSLQCTDCGATMPGWPLTRDVPVGETRTLGQGGHRVTRCNGCCAEGRLGEAVRRSRDAPGAPAVDERRLLQDWLDAARNRTAAEVRAGRHGPVASADVGDLIFSLAFEAMRRGLDAFEDDVQERVREAVESIEGSLDLRMPWNHAVVPPVEASEAEDSSDDGWWLDSPVNPWGF